MPQRRAVLPNAGQTVGGLFDPNPIVAPRNVMKSASDFGKQYQHWDGFDLSVDARLRNGLLLQGGVSAGKQMTDNCEIVDAVPESLSIPAALPAGIQAPIDDRLRRAQRRRPSAIRRRRIQPLYKGLVSYLAVVRHPRRRHVPEPARSAGRRDQHLQQHEPDGDHDAAAAVHAGSGQRERDRARHEWGDRLNQIDLRFTKVLNIGTGRIDLNVDFFNAFNSDAVIAELGTFGPVWRLPLTVIQPRFVKFGVRYDF